MGMTTAATERDVLSALGIADTNPGGFSGQWLGTGPELEVITPIDGTRIATINQVTEGEYDQIAERAHRAFLAWCRLPAPRRGDIVRQLGNRLRQVKRELGEARIIRFAAKICQEIATERGIHTAKYMAVMQARATNVDQANHGPVVAPQILTPIQGGGYAVRCFIA